MTDQQPHEPQQPPQPPYPGAAQAPTQPPTQPYYPGSHPAYSGAQPQHPGYPAPGYGYAPYGAPRAPRGAASPDDLSLPLYGATFGQAISRFFKKYATFSGRASRSEFWFAQLFLVLVQIVFFVLLGVVIAVTAVASASNPDGYLIIAGVAAVPIILLVLSGLAVIVPSLAISWRRLHDANFAGPFWFLSLTSVGSIVVLVFTILPSNAEGERFDAR